MSMQSPQISSSRGSGTSTKHFKDLDIKSIQYYFESESQHSDWWSREHIFEWLRSLPDDTLWNSFICVIALCAIVWVVIGDWGSITQLLDIMYNVVYGVHVLGIVYNLCVTVKILEFTWSMKLGVTIDLLTYSHYPLSVLYNPVKYNPVIKLACYYLRLHRPFKYLWALNDYNLKGSVLGTTLKYCYIFFVLRITWALIWLHIDEFERHYASMGDTHRALCSVQIDGGYRISGDLSEKSASQFLSALYIVNKMFIPIGPSVEPANDYERITCLLIMVTGCLVVTGAAVASLSSVISIYLKPEERFRARYRLIIKEMNDSNVPQVLRDKVETFYKMYWHKQRAVSATKLMPKFPPTIPITIYTDIYFEATQKSRLLRDLSYPFLSEVAKKMETIHYIPGDAIIKRSSTKSSVIFITYGDVEMLTAEDDSTAILRMTRGTVLTPGGVCAPAACSRAHVEIRAATFCTAHVLRAESLWKVALKYGRENGESEGIQEALYDHIEKVKRHYYQRIPVVAKFKSSILHFKQNLMALKEARDIHGNLLMAQTDVFLEIAGCYIMRNRTDSSLTDEADAICLRPTFPCILQPTSSLQMVWNCFVAVIIMAVCFTHPYFLVFRKTVPLEFRFFDYVVTVVYVFDILVHLSTGANVEEGVPITFSQTALQQMRSRWFVLDVLGTLPIFEFIQEGHFAGLNKLLRLPKVFCVLKSIEELYVYHSNIVRFLLYTLMFLTACYLIAALQQGFMCFQFGYCLVTNLTHSPFWVEAPLDEDTVANRLAFGLFWAICMITCTSHMETWGTERWKNVLYTMFVLELCIVLHIFIESMYSATISVTTSLRQEHDCCIANVKSFLDRNNVDAMLKQRFITYLQLCWYTDKSYAITMKKSIFHDLPPHVYQDIVARQRSKYILCIPFMKLLRQEDLKMMSSNARVFYTSPNEILLNTGDISNEIYVIKQGICEILNPNTQSVVGDLGVKSHFGVLECLLRVPAFYTIRAVTHVQVLSISRKYLVNAMLVPKIKDAIEFAKEQPEYAYLQPRRAPFTMYKPLPASPNCEYFRLPRKHEPDDAFLLPFHRLGFLSVLRYMFPRFTIRPDGRYLMRYEFWRAFCAIASATLFPCYTYLVLQLPWLYGVAIVLDVAAYFDIVQRMLVGYFNDRGILVYHPASTAAHYLKGAFVADLLGCLPLENLELSRKDIYENKYRMTKIKQFLMLNRLLQLYRIQSTFLVLDDYFERRDIVLVIKAIPLFMALLSALTCLMVYFSVNVYYNSDSTRWYIEPLDDPGGSWINLFNDAFRFNLTESPWNLHLATYFWIVFQTTTTGYGSLRPSNFDLMQVLFVGMVVGAMMTTYFSVRIISMRATVNTVLAAYQEHLKDMVVFMKRANLNKQLQREVMYYYQYNWDKMGGVDYRNVVKLCDQITLRTDTTLNLYGPTFEKCQVLSDCDVSLLRIIGRAVRSQYFLKHTVIVQKDDVTSEMYFVDYGSVEIQDSVDDVSELTQLARGSMFGNLVGARSAVRCPLSFVASSDVHLLLMNANMFHNIIADFKDVKALLERCLTVNENFVPGLVTADEVPIKPWKYRSLSSAVMTKHRKKIVKSLRIRNTLIQGYLLLISLMCVYGDVYNAGFQDNRAGLIVALYVLDLAFYLKILVKTWLPQLVEDMEAKKLLLISRATYFHNDLKYDIISCLPIELFSFLGNKNRWLLFSWLRLNRMFRVTTIRRCLKHHRRRLNINLMLSTVTSVTVWFTLFVHTCTCLWYFIGVMEDARKPKSSWLYTDEGKPWCYNYYICSLYFVLTTFIQNGVGDIMPKKHSEVIFVTILQLISTMVFMIYVGEFSNIIQYKSFRSFKFYSNYLELQEFLKNNRVSKNLVNMLNKYSLHLWRETRGEQVPHFLSTAPIGLKLKVMSAAYLDHLLNHIVFKDCEPAFLRQLVGCLHMFTYNEDMFVVKEREITDSMYLIHTGRVEESAEDDEFSIKIYYAGEFFGVGLTRDLPYKHTYKTLIKSQVLTLNLNDWEYLLEHFPKSKETVYKHINFDHKPNDDKHSQRRVTISTPSRHPGQQFSSSNPVGPPPPPPSQPPLPPEVDRGTFPGYPTESFSNEPRDEREASVELLKPQSSQQYQHKSSMRLPTHNENISGNQVPSDTSISLAKFTKSKSTVQIKSLSDTKLKDQVPGTSKQVMQQKHIQDKQPLKKLLERQLSTDIDEFSEDMAKDELLLEEDEEITTALIEQFEEVAKEEKEKVGKSDLTTDGTDSDIEEKEKQLWSIIMQDVGNADDISQKTSGSSEDAMSTELSLKSVEHYLHENKNRFRFFNRVNRKKAEETLDLTLTSENIQQPQQHKKPHTHVRYEDEEAGPSHATRSHHSTSQEYDEWFLKSTHDLTTEERNLRTLDSDLNLVKTSKPDTDDSSSTQGDGSSCDESHQKLDKPKS